MGAAQYILWYGQSLFKHIICQGEISAENKKMWHFGRHHEGQQLLGQGRWRFCMESFCAAARNETFAAECRSVAGNAANIMEALEGGMPS